MSLTNRFLASSRDDRDWSLLTLLLRFTHKNYFCFIYELVAKDGQLQTLAKQTSSSSPEGQLCKNG